MNFLGDPQDTGAMTFAEAGDGLGFTERLKSTVDTALKFTPGAIARSITSDIIEGKDFGGLYNAAERQTRLVDNIVSHESSIEEAYDRRIKAVKDATGIALDNPERLRLTERELRQINRDGPVDPAAWKRQQFDQKLAETRNQHPDAVDALTFGNIDQEARAIAKGAEDEYEQAKKDTNLSGASSLVAEFGGGFKGMLRDPLFVGSMFAGPTTAVGKTVGARILTSGLFQGLYNAGLSALEQPSVQAWRAEIGAKSGAVPAVENVGLAFLFGAIPGVGFRAIHEIPAGARPAVQRVLAGTPEAGDLDQVMKVAKDALGEIDRDIPGLGPREAAAIKLGEEMDTADRVTRPPPAKDVPPELHDDLTAAALKRADNPEAPSPQAVEALRDPERLPAEVSDRIAAADPQNLTEAQRAASEALEDIGNRETITRVRTEMERDRLPEPVEPFAPPVKGSKDPLDRVAMARDDGTPTTLSARQLNDVAGENWYKGERDGWYADIIRECK